MTDTSRWGIAAESGIQAREGGMHFWDAYWALEIDRCPCDVHFTDYLEASGIHDASIFHFGTGGHHHLGLRIAEVGSNNAVYGITASPAEYDTYVKLTIDRPEVGRLYKVFFGDIYQLDARMLPDFDVATLFHLCEFRTEKNDLYNALTDLEVAEMLVDRLKPGGRVLFYPGSFAWPTAEGVVAQLVARKGLIAEDGFKSLVVCRKPG